MPAIDPAQMQMWLAQVQMMNDRQAAKQAGKNQRSQLQMLMQLLEQAGSKELAANQANESRYADILELLGINRRDQIGMVDQYGQSMRDDTGRRFDVDLKNQLSDLSSRGLSGTTISNSIKTRNTREKNAELRRLEDDLLRNRMDVRDRTLSPITGVMERRSDVGPDLGGINALAGQAGLSGIGGVGGIGGGIGGIRGGRGITNMGPGTYGSQAIGGGGFRPGPSNTGPGTYGSTASSIPVQQPIRPSVTGTFAGMPAKPWLYGNAGAAPAQTMLPGDQPLRGVAGDNGFYPSGADPTRTNPFSAYFGGSKPIGWGDRGANFSIVENWQAANGPFQQGRPILGGPIMDGSPMMPSLGIGSQYAPRRPIRLGNTSTSQPGSGMRAGVRRPPLNHYVTPPTYGRVSPYAYA